MSYAVTKSRIVQWIGIILIIGVFAGAYWYFKVYGSTLNQSQNDLNTNGLVGLWSFNGDDISGTTAYDRSVSGNNGTLTNGPVVTQGKVGQALLFDGTDDYVTVTSATALNPTSAITTSAWIKRGIIGTRQFILNKGGSSGASDHQYWLEITAANLVVFLVASNSTGYSVTSPTTLTDTNGWHHIAGTYDGVTQKLYIDGVLVASASVAITLNTTTDNLAIGNRSTFNGIPYSGSIDETRIYNRALAAGEVQSLYAQGGGTKVGSAVSQPQGTGRLDSGLAGYWKLDDGMGSPTVIATDSSTNANTGTLTNGPTWTTGQIGGALDFDGTNDHVTAVDPASGVLDITDNANLTLSGWFNRDTFTTDDMLISKRSVSTSNTGYVLYIDDATDKLTFNGHDGTDSYQLESVTTFTATGWYHYTIVWDDSGAGQTKLYINGVSEAATTTGTFGNVNSMANGSPFMIGATTDGLDSPSSIFDGKIDEIRIYTRALSADEVAQLYRLNSPTSVDTGLKGYWSFNAPDMNGTSAYDRSGAGNTGTLTGSPTRTIGKIGQALNMVATSSYVTIPDSASLSPTAAFTLSFWIRPTATVTGSEKTLVLKSETSQRTFHVQSTSAGAVKFNVASSIGDSGSNYGVSPDGVIVQNQWTHVTTVFDGAGSGNSGRAKIYINGVEQPVTYTGTIAATVPNATSPLVFGSLLTATYDEVRFYSRALTAAEIKGLYDVGADDKVNSSASQAQGTGRLDSGLAGYWKLDDGSGTSATDASTNGNTGTLTNGPTWTTGQIDGAVSFDGSDDYIDAGDQATLEINNNSLTIGGWFKLDTFPGSNRMFLITKGGTAAHYEYEIAVQAALSNKLRFAIFNTSTSAYLFTDTLSAPTIGTWFHVVGVFDKDALSVKVYFNGALESISTSTSGIIESTRTANFNIGRRADNAENKLDGLADEVRVYNRALSADEVSQLYRLTAPTGAETGLKGYWSFNGQDMSGTTAYDRSGAGNNGTLTNGPTKTIGKIGQALNFDGTNDYVDTGTRVGPASAYSSCLWAKPRTVSGTKVLFSAYSDTGGIRKLYNQFFINGAGFAGRMIGTYSAGFHYIGRSVASGLVANQWSFLCMTWDGGTTASSIKLYQDGVQVDTTDDSGGTFTTISSDSVHFWIGAQEYIGVPNNPMNGQLDEVRVYSRALSDREIWSLYQSGGGLANSCESGSVADADGNVYGTVNIGSQCWMKQNMRVGTRIAAASSQTNNVTTEKYCYSDSDANCTGNNPNQPDGGLYQWDEAMQYVTTAGAQGICPAGFHIPTDTEWYVLENHLKDTGQTCSASRSGAYDCSSAGTKLKSNGTSDFEGNLAGYFSSGSFFNRASLGSFWSSSESSVNAWYRILNSSATINRNANSKTNGRSIRCIQDLTLTYLSFPVYGGLTPEYKYQGPSLVLSLV